MNKEDRILQIPYITNSANFTARMLDNGEIDRAEREIAYVVRHDGVTREEYLELVESKRKKTTIKGWV